MSIGFELWAVSPDGQCMPERARLPPGRKIGPVAVGHDGEWRIEGNGVPRIALYLYFDGEALFALSGAPGTRINGAALGDRWTKVPVPGEIRFGSASIVMSLESVGLEDSGVGIANAVSAPRVSAAFRLLSRPSNPDDLPRDEVTVPSLRLRARRSSLPRALRAAVALGVLVVAALLSNHARLDDRKLALSARTHAPAAPAQLARELDVLGATEGRSIEEDELRAISLASAGSYEEAAALYAKLAQRVPGQLAYSVAARILHERATRAR